MPQYCCGKFKVKENGMSTTIIKRIKTLYAAVLSACLVATGILLMIACVRIYRIGDRPFTTENIADAFSRIRPIVLVTLALTAVGILLWLFLPSEKKKNKGAMPAKALAARLERKLSPDTCPVPILASIALEKRYRKILRIVTAIACVEAFVPALVYVLNFDHFTMDYNSNIITACMWLLPGALISLGMCLTASFLMSASEQAQLEDVKRGIAARGKTDAPIEEPVRKSGKGLLIVRIAVFAIAVAMIVMGVLNDGMADVLAKAINICTECIGLG